MVRDSSYRITDRTAYQILDGLAVVVATRKRMVHRLNDVGSDIWQALEQNRSADDILRRIVETYEIEESTAWRDLEEFLHILMKLELVEAAS